MRKRFSRLVWKLSRCSSYFGEPFLNLGTKWEQNGTKINIIRMVYSLNISCWCRVKFTTSITTTIVLSESLTVIEGNWELNLNQRTETFPQSNREKLWYSLILIIVLFQKLLLDSVARHFLSLYFLVSTRRTRYSSTGMKKPLRERQHFTVNIR